MKSIKLFVTVFSMTLLCSQMQINVKEFAARRAKVFEKIGTNIAIIWAATAQAAPIKFRQSPDFYYLTGIEEEDAILVLNGQNKSSYIFARKIDANGLRWNGYSIWQEEKFRDTFGINSLIEYANFWQYLSYLAADKAIYMPLSPIDDLHKSRSEKRSDEFNLMSHPAFNFKPDWQEAITKVKEMMPVSEIKDINPILDEMRWIKSDYEIEQFKKSGEIGAQGLIEAIKDTKPGMYEYEIAATATYYFSKLGARDAGFPPIAASGPNTYIIHYGANDRKMEKGDFVLLDYGPDYNYYITDLTRTWPVSGKFTAEEEKMYNCIYEAREAIIKAMKPGATINQLKEIAHNVYKKYGYAEAHLGWGKYIGHPVGLSVHDATPYGNDHPLEAGVVFNVEPVIDDHENKRHMRLEDSVLITKNGAINLTGSLPAKLDEIYKLLNERGLSERK